MTYIEKEIVRTDIRANSREDLIAKLTDWANKLTYDNSIAISIVAIVSGVPYEAIGEQV
jgi:hypothetical protein